MNPDFLLTDSKSDGADWLDDEFWLCQLAYMADISHKLNKPNLQPWGSGENIYNMQEIIFLQLLKLW